MRIKLCYNLHYAYVSRYKSLISALSLGLSVSTTKRFTQGSRKI
nr:MAG TPA: hypothetical protein [Caudoviricetes sp.]